MNYTRGQHNFRFGGEVRAVRLYTDRLGGTTYTYASSSELSDCHTPRQCSSLDDLSSPSPFTGDVGQRFAKQEYYIAYAQDQWQLRHGLTLNYGLRYEKYTPLRERNDGCRSCSTSRPAPSAIRQRPPTRLRTAVSARGSRLVGRRMRPAVASSAVVTAFSAAALGSTMDQAKPRTRSSRSRATASRRPLRAAPCWLFRRTFQLSSRISSSNPNNRSYQPRAYSNDYTVPERVYQYSFSYQQELRGHLVGTVAYVGAQGETCSCAASPIRFCAGRLRSLRPPLRFRPARAQSTFSTPRARR